MLYHKLKMFLLLCVGLIQYTWSQDYIPSLKMLSEKAIQNNPKIEQITIQKQMQLAEVDQVEILPDPLLSYSWFGESVETRVGPQEQKFGIQQKIPWPAKITHKKAVKKKVAEITESMISKTKATLIYEVRKTWSEIQYLHLYKEVIDTTILLYQRWSKTLLSEYKTGKSSYSRVLKMESEIEILKDEKNTVKRIIRDKNQYLIELTAENLDDEIQVEQSFQKYAIQNGQEIITANFDSSFNLKEAKAHKKYWAKKRKLDQNGFFPDFIIGLGYIQIGESPGMPESGKDAWLLNFGMTLPIFGGKNSAKMRESNFGIKKAHAYEKEQTLALKKNTEIALEQISESIRKRELYQGSILKRLNQSISVLEKQYHTGTQNFMELLDDYRQRLILNKKIYGTFKQEFQAKARILWLLGDESTEFSFPYQIPVYNKESEK